MKKRILCTDCKTRYAVPPAGYRVIRRTGTALNDMACDDCQRTIGQRDLCHAITILKPGETYRPWETPFIRH